MSGGNGVFTAFPDKVHRHWKSFAVAFIAVSAFLYVIIPSNNEDVAFDVSGLVLLLSSQLLVAPLPIHYCGRPDTVSSHPFGLPPPCS